MTRPRTPNNDTYASPTRRILLGAMAAMTTAVTTMRSAPLLADQKPTAKLDSFMDSEITARSVPGIAVRATRRGLKVYERYAGTYCSNETASEILTADVLHPLYSFSKLVSATVIVMLHQDGHLDYDVPVSKYIPEFTGGGKEKITIRHLLSHSAGIPSVPIGAIGNEEQWNTAVKAACAASVEWEPGAKCAYHGLSGLFVAAEAARRVTGKSWQALCSERLFKPLRTKTLTFEIPESGRKLALTPQPKPDELTKLGKYGDFYRISGALGHPAGGCFGTLEDMLKVLNLHLENGMANGKRLLSPKSLEEMHTVQYEAQISADLNQGKAPVHGTWGLGPLIRGTHAADGTHAWFGFGSRSSPDIFGHAGISTVIGVADPESGVALAFISTGVPKPEADAPRIRNGVTDRVFDAFASK